MSTSLADRTEKRRNMMALAEVSWQDQSGTYRDIPAKIENTSPSGACIRLKQPVNVGAKLHVRWYREQFSGTSRYCLRQGSDYFLGIHRDGARNASQVPLLPPPIPTVQAEPVPIENA